MILSEGFLAQLKHLSSNNHFRFTFAVAAMSIRSFIIDVGQGCFTTWTRTSAQTYTVADIRGFIPAAPSSFKGGPENGGVQTSGLNTFE